MPRKGNGRGEPNDYTLCHDAIPAACGKLTHQLHVVHTLILRSLHFEVADQQRSVNVNRSLCSPNTRPTYMTTYICRPSLFSVWLYRSKLQDSLRTVPYRSATISSCLVCDQLNRMRHRRNLVGDGGLEKVGGHVPPPPTFSTRGAYHILSPPTFYTKRYFQG